MRPAAGTYTYPNIKHKSAINFTNIKHIILPLGAPGSYLQGPTPMATGGGRGRSYAGKARSKMAGSYASRWLGDTLEALVGDADGSQLGTTVGVCRAGSETRWKH